MRDHGKGWHKHSREHALAARGVSTKANGMFADRVHDQELTRHGEVIGRLVNEIIEEKEEEHDYLWEVDIDEVLDMVDKAVEDVYRWHALIIASGKNDPKSEETSYYIGQYIKSYADARVLRYIALTRIVDEELVDKMDRIAPRE